MLSELVNTVTSVRPADRWRIATRVIADFAGKTIVLLVTVAAARMLSREAFGVLALGMTLGWLLGVASDAGLSMYLAREIAWRPADAFGVVRAVARVRGVAGAMAIGVGAVVSGLVAPAGSALPMLMIVTAQVAGAHVETMGHVFRGLERSEIEAAVNASQRVLLAVLASLVLWRAPSLPWVAVAMLVPAVAALVAATWLALRMSPQMTVETGQATESALRLLKAAWPIGLGVLVSALYFRIDVFFVEEWRGLEAVAGYNAVFRIVEGLRLLPGAVLVVTFPALCRAVDLAPLRRVSLGLGAVAAAATVATWLAARPLVVTIYGGRYADSAPVLRLLALSLPLLFVNYALTHQVLAWGGQRAYLWVTVAALAVNLAANLALVPSWGAQGAAVATLVTEVAVSSGCVVALLATAAPAAVSRGVATEAAS